MTNDMAKEWLEELELCEDASPVAVARCVGLYLVALRERRGLDNPDDLLNDSISEADTAEWAEYRKAVIDGLTTSNDAMIGAAVRKLVTGYVSHIIRLRAE